MFKEERRFGSHIHAAGVTAGGGCGFLATFVGSCEVVALSPNQGRSLVRSFKGFSQASATIAAARIISMRTRTRC